MEPSAEVDDAADVVPTRLVTIVPRLSRLSQRRRSRCVTAWRGRGAFSDAIGSVLGRSAIDDSVWEELEDALLIADVGISVATSLLDPLRERA